MTTDHELPDDEHTQRLAEALHAEVDHLEVSTDSLARIQARTTTWRGRTSWRWIAPLAAAAVVAVVAAGAVLLPDRTQHTATPPAASLSPTDVPTTTSPSPEPTSSPSPSVSSSACPAGPYVPVPSYFVKTFEGRSALYREFLALNHCWTAPPAVNGETSVMQAVHNMAQPETYGLDYQSLWSAGLEVTALTRDGDTAVLTLNGAPTGNPELAMQQLVYTVTAADNTIHRIGVQMPGSTYETPYGRAPASDVLAPVWLTDASAEATSKGYVIHLTGTASVFEATVNWQITDETGKVVDSGFATTPEAGPARGPWTATSKPLPKNHYYTVTAFEASAQDGRMTWPDTRTAP